jgi:hypothetical protein
MVLLVDEAQVEAQFYPFGDSANLDARYVHGLCQTHHRLTNCFGRTRWNSYVMWFMWKLVSVYLGMVLASVEDRCTICTKRTIGSEIISDAPDGTPR